MVAKDELKHMSWISRLELSDVEIERFCHQISDTIKYIDVLDTIRSENLDLDLQILDYSSLREDISAEFIGDLIAKSAVTQEGLVKGPRMG